MKLKAEDYDHVFHTGYFATYGRGQASKVHLVLVSSHRAICGCAHKNEFQWCAHGIEYSYLTCEKCKRVARQFLGK